jgi:hypothetical protein
MRDSEYYSWQSLLVGDTLRVSWIGRAFRALQLLINHN